jgi:hypothetical protein
MITIMDLEAELAKLTMLRGRTPETPAVERERAFARLAPYDGAHHDRGRAGSLRAQGGDGGDPPAREVAPVRGARRSELNDRDTSTDRASHRRRR